MASDGMIVVYSGSLEGYHTSTTRSLDQVYGSSGGSLTLGVLVGVDDKQTVLLYMVIVVVSLILGRCSRPGLV